MQISNVVAHAATPSSGADNSGTTTDSSTSTGTLASTDTFLKLLVAQIKNQDPTQPSDPTQFLGELAQFSQLDQLIGIRQGVDALGTAVNGSASGSNTGSGSTGTGNTQG